MKSNNQLLQTIDKKNNIIYRYIDTTNLCNQIIKTNNCDPISAHILCRATTAAILTIPTITKNNPESKQLQYIWQYSGKLKQIKIDYTNPKNLTATIEPTNLMSISTTEKEIFGECGTITISHNKQKSPTLTNQTHFLDVVDDLSHLFCIKQKLETILIATITFAPNPDQPVKESHAIMLQEIENCNLNQLQKQREKLEALANNQMFHKQNNQTPLQFFNNLLP